MKVLINASILIGGGSVGYSLVEEGGEQRSFSTTFYKEDSPLDAVEALRMLANHLENDVKYRTPLSAVDELLGGRAVHPGPDAGPV